ncbi:hypothetical protein KCTCHS21_35180 [Cohnella abietis]|uniref:Uncharacterized protein n=1 Tax=Cohnella abietis TaxID=2507935 RepID=A0A3T1D7T8_9BACL|nr:hypothetical protein KCTCHS21_35180 [Cohnella abietis]
MQQLHPVILSSLRSIYNEKYSQFSCERILSINERVAIKNRNNKARPVGAIHGAKYFEITIGLCRPDGESVELYIKNDTGSVQYHLAGFKKTSADSRKND